MVVLKNHKTNLLVITTSTRVVGISSHVS